MAWLYLLLPLIEGLAYLSGPCSVAGITLIDAPYLVLLSLHFLIPLFCLHKKRKRILFTLFRLPELLFLLTFFFFLFAYIYALNANMDYVQRFMATGGAIKLAIDTTRERLIAVVRYLPLLVINIFYYLYWRLKRKRLFSSFTAIHDWRHRWALPLVLFSALLLTFCFPSFISLEGLPLLAFFALVPLFWVFAACNHRWGVVYGTAFGVVQGMLINYWLGTFSLITLQVVVLFFFISYLLFLVPLLWLYKRNRQIGFFIFPTAWVFFDFLRTGGFLGYPWGMVGSSQYAFLPLIQIASITGIWGVSFIVLLVNAALAYLFPDRPGRPLDRKALRWRLIPTAGLMLLVLTGGTIYLLVSGDGVEREDPTARPVRVALIQQNSDPRKHDYRETFEKLKILTDKTMVEDPDIVIWSETAFVPNIRRWSRYDPDKYALARVVRDFLEYQQNIGTWLLTGNDDYELSKDENGEEVRLDYNAAVLFSPDGERVKTYHKLHLIPFTEYFPYKESLRGFYKLLLAFDVYLWEPGRERVVFDHPRFSFITPICFEDAFPDDIRRFIKQGAEVIINISNDYWSLTEVEAKQHYINSLFRAVENRRPLLRATASGLTCYVDPSGKLAAAVPYYSEEYLLAEVPVGNSKLTFYTRYGDWFPILQGIMLAVLALATLVTLATKVRRKNP